MQYYTMYNQIYSPEEAQRQYEERIREAKASHALQRRQIQQVANAITWLGTQLIAWSARLQTQQALTIQSH